MCGWEYELLLAWAIGLNMILLLMIAGLMQLLKKRT